MRMYLPVPGRPRKWIYLTIFHAYRRAAVAASAPTPVPVPNTVPSDASPPIDPSFAAFAFEETSFYLYAGTSAHDHSLELMIHSDTLQALQDSQINSL